MPTRAVTDDPLAHGGEHVVGQLDQVEGSTLTAAAGSCSRSALRKAADGSIATTSTAFRQAGLRAASHAPTPAQSRPLTTPSTRPVSTSTNVKFIYTLRRSDQNLPARR
jgi:hypothetical protein